MSYLYLSQGNPGFSKAVISLWFRAPKKSLEAAEAAYKNDATVLFNGMIPLLIMGKKGTGGETDTEPTYIAINCSGGADNAFLDIKFETCKLPTWDGYDLQPSSVTLTGRTLTSIKGDHWHHLLISPDFTGSVATHGFAFDDDLLDPDDISRDHVDSAFKLYMAVDDVNLLGDDLSGDYPHGNADKHAITTTDAMRIANAFQKSEKPPGEPEVAAGPIPTYSGTGSVPSGIMGLPGIPEFEQNIYRVELAEFQMWTGKTLDTGVTSNRRAFVDRHGVPIDPSRAERLLGKPAILLHGSSNWINGVNTGSSGFATGTARRQFRTVALIRAYTPDPSLEETTA